MQKHQKYEDLLMRAIGFDEADLAANQAGELSEWQKAHLPDYTGFWLDRTNWVLAAVLVFGGLLLWLKGVFSTSVESPVIDGVMLILGAFAVIQYFNFRRREDAKPLVKSRVSFVEGRIQLDFYTSNYSREYRLRIDSMEFMVAKGVFLAFKNGDPYRIYYAPHTLQILSVEWLRDDDNLLDETN